MAVLYIGKNPFKLDKRQEHFPEFTYGETPLEIYEFMASVIKPTETFAELGSGRGRGLLFLNRAWGIKVQGIEILWSFVKELSFLCRYLFINDVNVAVGDLQKDPLMPADVIYIAGTCFSQDLLTHISSELEKIKPRVIVSLSTSLEEYGLKSYKALEHQVWMPWGKSTLYIMELTEA